MKTTILIALVFLSGHFSSAQEISFKPDHPTFFNLGIGVGLDYGGVGAKIPLVTLTKCAQLFGGLGYNGAGVGVNSGLLFRSSPERDLATYCTLMYGYNAVLITESVGGKSRTERMYFGPSLGGGIEYRTRPEANFFTLGLLFPIRSEKFDDAARLLNPVSKPANFIMSVGYHLTFGKK